MAYNKAEKSDSPMKRRGGRRRKKVCVDLYFSEKHFLRKLQGDLRKQPDSAAHVYFLHESLRGNDSDASLLQYVRLPGNAAGASFPERHV